MILLITYLLNLFDLYMTLYWVYRYGLEAEGNPVGRWLLETGLAVPWKVFGIGMCLIVMREAVKRKPQYAWTGWLVLAVYALLAV